MRSNQPYLLRAFYDWIVDNQCTPYIIVDAFHEGTEVPQEFVKGGQIVLMVRLTIKYVLVLLLKGVTLCVWCMV